MVSWSLLLGEVALTAAGAVVASRMRFFRARPWAVGVLFGVLSYALQCCPVGKVDYFGVEILLHQAPLVVAGFFFGPVAGMIAGGIASVACGLSVIELADATLAVRGALATEAVALYAVSLGEWVFDDRRPPICTAAIAAAYAIVVYLAVGAMFGLNDLPRTLEIIVAAFVPQTVGVGLAAALASLAGRDKRTWQFGFRTSSNLVFLFVGLAVAATTTAIGLNAKEQGDAIVRHAAANLTTEGDDQARYMLHEHAVNIVKALSGLKHAPTREDLVRLASTFEVDVVEIVDTNAVLVATSDVRHTPGRQIVLDPDVLRQYLELGEGKRPFVNEQFRPYEGDAGEEVKYFGFPLPSGGLLRVGYFWSSFVRIFPPQFLPALDGRRIGETGYYLIFDDSGRTVLDVPDRPETKRKTFAEIGFREKDRERPYETVFHARILGELCRCVAYEPFGRYQVYAVLPLAETQGPALVIATIVAVVLLIVCIVFRLVLVRFQKAQAKIDALRADKERHRAADLALARAIQQAELRTDGREGDGYRIDAQMDAAREVGGDFYDYYELPDGRLVVTMADVSGKGIPAAFFMMKARTTLKSCVHEKPTLAEAVAEANVRLARNNPAEMFVTAWVGVWERGTGRLDFVSAGHNPPLVRRGDGAVAWVQAPRTAALGVFEKARYRGASMAFGAGDRLFLYTDGVNEAMDGRGELFGNERLEAALRAAQGPLVAAVREAVDAFVAGAEQADDITVLELAAGCR